MQYTKATTAVRTFNLQGDGVLSLQKNLAMSLSAIAEGDVTMTRSVVASKTFNLTGEGVVSRLMALVLARSLVADGDLTYIKATTAVRILNAVAEGNPKMRVEMDYDDIPDGESTTIVKRIFAILD